MTSQKQSVDGGQAIQAGGDVSIQNGITTEQMLEIMKGLSEQTVAFRQIAIDIADARIEKFRHDVLEKFTRKDEAKPEAFSDPDFQAVLGSAQFSASRSDDPATAEMLIDLLARRSLETKRSRLSLTLNAAIERTADLTEDELNAITLNYICLHTVNNGIYSIPSLATYIENTLMPFASKLSTEEMSILHIEAVGCGFVDRLGSVDLLGHWKKTYPNAATLGFTRERLEKLVPDTVTRSMVDRFIEPTSPGSDKFKFTVPENVLSSILAGVNFPAATIWPTLIAEQMADEKILEALDSAISGTSGIFKVWEQNPIKILRLNNIGVAIGYSNAVRLKKFNAPIGIWIK